MKKLKLGIIGLSAGNGHPYSWSAIFNGYNPRYMAQCPFPSIPQYLSKQTFPKDSIKNATVSHIWTQDKELSKHISKASNIETIVNRYSDMIGEVDAILLARDDAKTHYTISKPFIQAGLPIYIDKPIAITTASAKKIFSLEKYPNQIFTCSALSYAKEFSLTTNDFEKLGEIKRIDAYTMKDWGKYSIHIIEPTLKIIEASHGSTKKSSLTDTKIISYNNQKIVTFKWNRGLITTFNTLGNIQTPIAIHLFGTKGHKTLVFEDTFYAFKQALQTFVNIVQKKEVCPSKQFVLKTINLIERGLGYE